MRDHQCWIHIVGRNTLLNNLLSSFLQQSLGASCTCSETMHGVAKKGSEELAGIMLVDCFSMEGAQILELIQSSPPGNSGSNTVALINLSVGACVELPALRSGIRGFFYLQDHPEALAKGIHALLNKDYWVSRKLLVEFLSTPNPTAGQAVHYPGLTLRESELMGLLAQGFSNQALADRLFISIPTVKSHLSSIYRKINVKNRLQALCWAETHHSGDTPS